MGLKVLPKIIIVGAVVVAAGFGINYGLTKFNASQPTQVSTVAPTDIPVAVRPEVTQPVEQTPPVTNVVESPTRESVSNGGKGLDALMKAGRK